MVPTPKAPPVLGAVDLSKVGKEEPQLIVASEQILRLADFGFVPAHGPEGQVSVVLRFDTPTGNGLCHRTTVPFDLNGWKAYSDQVRRLDDFLQKILEPETAEVEPTEIVTESEPVETAVEAA